MPIRRWRLLPSEAHRWASIKQDVRDFAQSLDAGEIIREAPGSFSDDLCLEIEAQSMALDVVSWVMPLLDLIPEPTGD